MLSHTLSIRLSKEVANSIEKTGKDASAFARAAIHEKLERTGSEEILNSIRAEQLIDRQKKLLWLYHATHRLETTIKYLNKEQKREITLNLYNMVCTMSKLPENQELKQHYVKVAEELRSQLISLAPSETRQAILNSRLYRDVKNLNQEQQEDFVNSLS